MKRSTVTLLVIIAFIAGVAVCTGGFLVIAPVEIGQRGQVVVFRNTGAALSGVTVQVSSAGVEYELKLDKLKRGETEVNVDQFTPRGKAVADYGTAVSGSRLGMGWTVYSPTKLQLPVLATVDPDR